MIQQETEFRLMSIDDVELLHKICCDAYTQNFYNHWEPGGLENYLNNSFGQDVLAAELNNNRIQYYVAFINNNPVAFMKINLSPDIDGQNNSQDIELEKIYVLPLFKGMNIGKKLLNIAFNIAEKNCKKIFWLSVIDTNEEAIAFYKKRGFRFYDKTIIDYPHFKEELKGMWRMYLRLNANDI
ncbi:GNAT family N-acetyltransferase [Parafilimonas sp.]|uniref:GNAT family N-acetyltransferase n=1 Tax=Parafilimonas sp. TaxID=1969739 RepID=UPI003F7ED2D1